MKFATRLLTFNPAPGDRHTPANTPIYQTATFRQSDATEFGEYDYSRSGNPTRAVVEKHIAALEGGTRGFCFSTGLAAITAVTRLLVPGDEILACNDLYGGSYRLFSRILPKRGIQVRYVDFSDLDAVVASISDNTKLVYLETLKASGISDDQARAHAHALDEALRDSVATKGDIERLGYEMKAMEQRMIIKMGAMMVALAAFLSAIKFVGH